MKKWGLMVFCLMLMVLAACTPIPPVDQSDIVELRGLYPANDIAPAMASVQELTLEEVLEITKGYAVITVLERLEDVQGDPPGPDSIMHELNEKAARLYEQLPEEAKKGTGSPQMLGIETHCRFKIRVEDVIWQQDELYGEAFKAGEEYVIIDNVIFLGALRFLQKEGARLLVPLMWGSKDTGFEQMLHVSRQWAFYALEDGRILSTSYGEPDENFSGMALEDYAQYVNKKMG